MDLILSALVWFSLVSAGIMAGVYFTFSVFAMRSFAELGDEAGARAMQSINRVIVRSAFLPLFFFSTLDSGALVALGLLGHAGRDRGRWRGLCDRHVRRDGRGQCADERPARRGGRGELGGQGRLARLPDALDAAEPCADRGVHGGDGVVCGGVIAGLE